MRLFLFILLLPTFLFSQNREGTITYIKTVDLYKTFQKNKVDLSKIKKNIFLLTFLENASIYKEVFDPRNKKLRPFSFEGTLLKHFDQRKSVRHIELDGEKFLVVDTIINYRWKLVNETKIILGFKCNKAVRKISRKVLNKSNSNQQIIDRPEIEIVAWYTTELPVRAGPADFNYLPGVILEVSVDNNTINISAIEFKNVAEKSNFIISNKGKLITSLEYEKILFQKLKYQISQN